MQLEPCKLKEVNWLAPDIHHQFFHIWSHGKNFEFPFLDLESPQNLRLDASWTIQIIGDHLSHTWYPSPIFPYLELQQKFWISLFGCGIPSKFRSRYMLNHPIQRRSPNHIHIGSYSEKFEFPSLDLESPQNLGLDASWTIQIIGDYLTCSWYPSPIFPYLELK